MSSFDNGFAVGYVIGKKQGGGPTPPEIIASFSYEGFLAISDKTLDGTANSDYSSSYTIEPA